jgi:hypothetical protein
VSIFPKWSTPPSESTVEQLGNHLILVLLAPSPAWFFVPTKREEAQLGYDASLQGMKACVLQYKRARPLLRGGVSVKINPRQLTVLTSRYGRGSAPYVFIGAAGYRSYIHISASAGASPLRRAELFVFVEAHAVPSGTTSIRFTSGGPGQPVGAQCFSKRNRIGNVLPCVTALGLVDNLLRCNIGHGVADVGEFVAHIRDGNGPGGKLSLLYMTPNP